MKKTHPLRAALALTLGVGLLAGCGGQSGTETTGGAGSAGSGGGGGASATAAPEYVYVPEFVPLKNDSQFGFYSGIYSGGKILATAWEDVPDPAQPDDPDARVNVQSIYTLSLDGTVTRFPYELPIPYEQDGKSYNSYANTIRLGEDGSLYLLEQTNVSWNDAPEGMTERDEDYWSYFHYQQSYALKIISPEGAVQREIDLAALKEVPREGSGREMIGISGEDDDYFYIGGMALSGDGKLCLSSEQTLYVLDAEGTLLGTIQMENWVESLISVGGTIYCAAYQDGVGEVLCQVDLDGVTLAEGIPVRGDLYSMRAGGGDYDLYYTSGINFYGLKLGDAEPVKLLNWLDCDIDPDAGEVMVTEDGRFLLLENDWDYSSENPSVSSSIAVLSKKPSASVPQKEVLTLATQSLGYQTRAAVLDFNRNSEKYRIEVRDYSEYNNYDSEDEADWSAGVTKLKTEILSGNVPDLLNLEGLPAQQFINKGYLEDLNPFLEKDPELGRDALVPSVLKAVESDDGKLYTTFSGFTLETVVGAKRIVGDTPGWTLREYREALARMPEGCDPFGKYMTRDNMLQICLSLDGNNFVNWATGECSFDSEGFVEMLEFVNSFPAEYDYSDEVYTEDDEPPARIARGEQMLYATTLSSPEDLLQIGAIFGGEPCFIGYPTAFGAGNMFGIYNSGFAMSSRCADKDAAWEFLRIFFTRSYQERNVWNLRSNREAFEKQLSDAMQPVYQTDSNGNPLLDEDGNKVEIDYGSWSWGGVEIKYHPLTAEDTALLRELIDTTTRLTTQDEDIYVIVSEGAAPFFAGQRSAQEVAKQIQSKASIYINEQR